MNKIQEAITEYWGPRCPNFNQWCHICQAWVEYDKIGDKLVRKFGKCSQCDAIIYLDGTVNKLCDKCFMESQML